MSQARTPQLGADYPGEQYYTGPPSHYPSHYYPAPYPAHYPPPPLTSYETSAPPPGEFSPHSDSSSHSPNSFEHTYHPYYAQVKNLHSLQISNCLYLSFKSPELVYVRSRYFSPATALVQSELTRGTSSVWGRTRRRGGERSPSTQPSHHSGTASPMFPAIQSSAR